MKLFAIGSAVPSSRQEMPSVTAANVVQHELLLSLASLGYDITFQPLFNQFRAGASLTDEEQAALDTLAPQGISLLPAIYAREYFPPVTSSLGQMGLRVWRLAGGTRFDLFYPSVRIAPVVVGRVRAARSDAVLTLWSPEGLAATHGLDDVPRVAYQGDIDFQTEQARRRDAQLFNGTGAPSGQLQSAVTRIRASMAATEAKRAHWRLMRRVSVIANVTAFNATYYQNHGHRRSVYVRNTWPDPRPTTARTPSPHPPAGTSVKIIGHVGYLNRTGSTYGLRFLLEEVVPALRHTMQGLDYRVEIIGGGEAVPALRPLLMQDRVVVRGFVPDLAAEFDSSDVVLLCNNAGPFQAAFTRHLVAWSLGACLAVHDKSRLAIPEIEPGENALVGATGAEMARLIGQAVTDPALNRRVRDGGRATYERYFTPHLVASNLSEEIQLAVNSSNGGGHR